MRVSVKYFDGEPPEPLQLTGEQWGTIPVQCPTEASILSVRKWDDKERFDWHLATVLKLRTGKECISWLNTPTRNRTKS